MSLSVRFDGHELSDYLSVLTGFDRGIGSTRQLDLLKIGNARGKEFLSLTNDEGSFSMPFVLRYDLIQKRRELAKILDVKEPKKLIFGDEPDKYYMAIPKGDIDVAESGFIGRGSITWVIPDAVAHSETIKTFIGKKNADGVTEIEINNQGTESVPVTYRIKHKKENGYLGIVSEHGVMQFGKIDELDGENYFQNELLVGTNDFSSWPDDKGRNLQNSNHKTNGKLGMENVQGQYVLKLTNAGSGNGWHGGMKTFEFPPDSSGQKGAKNWYCYFNLAYETGLVGQTGAMTVSFIDQNDRCIAAYIINKTDMSGNRANADFYIGGNNPRVWENITFTPSVYDENMYNWPRGHVDMIKEDDRIGFYYHGSRHTVSVPELRDSICTKVQIWMGQWGSRGLDLSYVSNVVLRGFAFQKMNVEKWRDVPNRYHAGSEFVVDGITTKPYFNGVLALDDEVKGTQYFLAPPGKTKVKIYHSYFGELEYAKAEIREAWV